MRITPCSSRGSRSNDPARRSGYQIAHGSAGSQTRACGRSMSASARSASWPIAYVRPSIVYSGFGTSPANGACRRNRRTSVTMISGLSPNTSSATPVGSLTSSYSTAESPACSSARTSTGESGAPPNASNCMNSRLSAVISSPSAPRPCSRTSTSSGLEPGAPSPMRGARAAPAALTWPLSADGHSRDRSGGRSRCRRPRAGALRGPGRARRRAPGCEPGVGAMRRRSAPRGTEG